MLAIGSAAGAASFTHVHNVAASHGQPGWLAWADAIVLELMSIASGLEMRRRKRAGTSLVFPSLVLGFAVALSLMAQVVEAEPSAIGWIAAAVPALGFLVMVKIALGRAGAPSAADRVEAVRTVRPSAGDGKRTAQGRKPSTRSNPDIQALLPAARRASQELAADGQRLTRETLAERLRADGYTVANARVSTLVRTLKTEAP
ncbi:DUF2637 domain-containing protein [Dactylosporangium sp. NBC_01737]|uniref:DUF2637 domain-containing protein n=1 Tax=Dactylosporangium sp. NBC_01737 TaxID=2975959 RepID=UPI002E0D994F|nr:DUF2637 domain-containing protein [Dactylosporangium sp. NBC_01737]